MIYLLKGTPRFNLGATYVAVANSPWEALGLFREKDPSLMGLEVSVLGIESNSTTRIVCADEASVVVVGGVAA